MTRILLLAILVFSASAQAFDISGTGTVWRAVDGDTFWISDVERSTFDQLWQKSQDPDHFNRKYSSIKIRIGGVDTEESTHKDRSKNTDRGRGISEHMKKLSAGQPARFRCWTIGKYGRPICAVNLQDIGDIGRYLITNGLSPYVTVWGAHPYLHEVYRQADAR
jgi:endonuclease YncB( thermonuclease family)